MMAARLMMRRIILTVWLFLLPAPVTWCFLRPKLSGVSQRTRFLTRSKNGQQDSINKNHSPYVMSVVEKARTVAASCSSATLCTSSIDKEQPQSIPFGSHVDYVLDSSGYPALLLNDQSLHTGYIKANPHVSLFAQMPTTTGVGQPPAAMARVTLTGQIQAIEDKDELLSLRTLYAVTHSFSQCLVDSKHFQFYKIIPKKIFYAGGFGVDAQFVQTNDYFIANADPLALKSLSLVNKLNYDFRGDLQLLCTQFIPEFKNCSEQLDVKVTTIDRLGFDIRVTSRGGSVTEEFRVGFMIKILSLEDAKSEIGKTLQSAWERAQGGVWDEIFPPIFLTNRDILGCD